jgi:hypothetical protein
MVGISPGRFGSDLAVPPAKTQRACLVTLLHWRRLQENTKISMLSHSLRRQQCLQVDNFDTERFIIEVQNRQNPKIGILPRGIFFFTANILGVLSGGSLGNSGGRPQMPREAMATLLAAALPCRPSEIWP